MFRNFVWCCAISESIFELYIDVIPGKARNNAGCQYAVSSVYLFKHKYTLSLHIKQQEVWSLLCLDHGIDKCIGNREPIAAELLPSRSGTSEVIKYSLETSRKRPNAKSHGSKKKRRNNGKLLRYHALWQALPPPRCTEENPAGSVLDVMSKGKSMQVAVSPACSSNLNSFSS